MIAKPGAAQGRYVGLLPIDPRDDFFWRIAQKTEAIDLKPEPIDLKPEPIDLKPEDVPFPNWQPSAGSHACSLARVLIAFFTGVAITLLWQSPYGDATRERIANLYPQVGWRAARPPITAEVAPARPPIDQLNGADQNAERIATTMAAGQELRTGSTDQIATGQEQMIHNTDQSATSVDQNSATEPSGPVVESRPDAAPLQSAGRLTEERPSQTLAEKGKPRSATSSRDGCFASASAVVENEPGAWPTWTLKAPGHAGSMCWYAAARPRGGDHRRERMPKEKETVRTAEHELFAPVAPHGRGGSWEGGLP
jgi:hypothetical protein